MMAKKENTFVVTGNVVRRARMTDSINLVEGVDHIIYPFACFSLWIATLFGSQKMERFV
jgi:hypothetical protein